MDNYKKTESKNTDTAPLITVIVPVYNIMEYLERCVHSITSQTYSNLEIILVDDGSTDKTGELCDELAKEDCRIKVFHKENGGSSSARNLALKKAEGEYVGFVDSDDYISETMYETLYLAIKKHGVNVAQVGRDEIDEQGNMLPNICEPPTEETVYSDEEFLKELIMHRGDCSFCTKLFKRELFEGRQFPIGKLNEDFNLLVNMLSDIGSIVSLPSQDYHVFYRMGSNSRKVEKDNFSRVFADSVDNADMVREIVDKKYPALSKVAFRFGVFQRIEYLLHIPISQMTCSNKQYCDIKKWMKHNWFKAMKNPYLTKKNKGYHTLFAVSPRFVRIVHKWMKHI